MEATQNPWAIVKGAVDCGLTRKCLGVYLGTLGVGRSTLRRPIKDDGHGNIHPIC
jgi:hypothetical protein